MSENVELHTRLIPQAHTALDDTAALLGMSRTDVVNRAIQLYGFLELERHAAGADLALIDPDGSVHRVSLSGDPEDVRARYERATRPPAPRGRRWLWSWKRGGS